ncbi:MAG: hypothetical protein R3B70_34415 [Polyangiaceae bacterium]
MLAVAALSFSCSAPEPKAKAPAAPVDAWAALPKSPEWLHATASFTGDRKAECAFIETWIAGEAECQATTCEHARDLSRDWLSRCDKLAPDSVSKVKDALAKYEARAGEKETPCAAQLRPIFGGACGKDETCEAAAQRWVTRCASTVASPLNVQILVRFVQRRVSDHDVELDTRSCSVLRDEVANGVTCTDRFKCEDAIAQLDMYSARCDEEGERPPLSFALASAVMHAAADRKMEPIFARPDDDASSAMKAKLPPTTADGAAVVASVCGTRVADLDGYFAARKECEPGGDIVFARAFKVQGSFEVRVGHVPQSDDVSFIARYPALLMPGERERIDRDRGAAFDTELEEAAKLSADPKLAPGGLVSLLALFRDHGAEIFRSEAKRAAIQARDASFVNAFKFLGKAKSKAKGPAAELGQIAARARTFAFSDIDPDGAPQFGAFSWAALHDTSALLPQSHAAYLKELKGFFLRTARDLPADDIDSDYARAFGVIAEECQQNGERARTDERALLECAFGQRTCDAPQVDALTKSSEKARSQAEQGFLAATFFMTTSGPKAAEFYRKVMSTAQCSLPAW